MDTLWQVFAVPADSQALSFSYRAEFDPYGLASFSASLVDPDTYLPLIPTNPDPNDPSATYYFQAASSGITLYDNAAVITIDLANGWRRVSLSLAGLLPGSNALLAFDFLALSSGEGAQTGRIFLDDVATSVPAPGAAILASLGLGLFGWARSRWRLV